MSQTLALLSLLCLPEEAERKSMQMPLCTVNPDAAQKLSSTGLGDKKTGLGGSWLAWKCPHTSCVSNNFRHHSAFSRNNLMVPKKNHREITEN